MDNSAFFERLKPHLLPVGLGLVGVGFLAYGLFSLIPQRQEKPDILFEAASTQAESTLAQEKNTSPKITVDIEGAVQKPGVYDLPSDARVQDALIAAGGMSTDADREKVAKGLNLAAKLTDGGKIYIPRIGDPTTGSGLASSGQGQTVLGTETPSGSININTASSSELDKLQGVGPVTAEKIIGSRPYAIVEELVKKKVVSQKVFEQIKGQITVY
jgi:competence protein ComEA